MKKLSAISLRLFLFVLVFSAVSVLQAQPNDNCLNAEVINITNGGYDLGVFTSSMVDPTSATLQGGEYIHPAQFSGNKSVWFKFTLPTHRQVQILLAQPVGGTMSPTDAGWTLYRTGSCLPLVGDVVEPSVPNIEGFTHDCLRPATYLIQVTLNATANQPIFMELTLNHPSAVETNYDFASRAYNFGTLNGSGPPATWQTTYDVGCQTIHPAEGTCPAANYTQSTWHVFRTDAHPDLMRFEVSQVSTWDNVARSWGFVLHQGDARLDSLPDGIAAGGSNLTTILPCTTITQTSTAVPAAAYVSCQLLPNTTYSIQLFHPLDYSRNIRVQLYEVGGVASISADPAAIAPSRLLGILPMGDTYTTDRFSCNGRMDLYTATCPELTGPGYYMSGADSMDVHQMMTFELNETTNVRFRLSNQAYVGAPIVMSRLYNGDVATDGCGAMTLYQTWRNNDQILRCLPAGKYTLQLIGRMNESRAHLGGQSNLGRIITERLTVGQQYDTRFSLHADGEVDSINAGNPLANATTYYATTDTFDCRQTVLPGGVSTCGAGVDRALYREVNIDRDGILYVGGGRSSLYTAGVRYRLFKGSANALATGYTNADVINGLVDQINCQPLYSGYGDLPAKVCVTPGIYTLVTYGNPVVVGDWDRPYFRFYDHVETQFQTPATANVLPVLSAGGPSVSATASRFSCEDNPNTILGYTPCSGYTKMIYREVYLANALLATVSFNYSEWMNTDGSATHRIFVGRVSDGSVSSLFRDCGGNMSNVCMPAGWYTIVSYGRGEDYTTPTYTGGRGYSVGDQTGFTITYDPDVQRYSTFATADSTYKVSPVYWEPRGVHTEPVPLLNKTVNFPTDYWDCGNNLPFPSGITACTGTNNRTSYRVFTLTKPSYVYMYNLGGHQTRLYQGDIRTQTPPFTVIQNCVTTNFRLCMQPGTYTMVSFAGDADRGGSIAPRLYVDSLGTSKYDRASNAYNFGDIPQTSTVYRANPAHALDALGRPQSNDFFFCSTGASSTDPRNNCPIGAVPPSSNPTNPSRNLWYTFTVTGPGRVYVSVYNMTSGKGQSPFAVYYSDNAVVPPHDSTTALGLVHVVNSTGYYCSNAQTVNFYINPCGPVITRRYYVLVNNNTGNEPNTQIQVGVRFDPAPPAFVLFDYITQANVISGNPTSNNAPPYDETPLTEGTYTGFEGNLNCATRSTPDPVACAAEKTLWYKVNVGLTGYLYLNYTRPNGTTTYSNNDIRIYRQTIPGDTTTASLVQVPLTSTSLVNPDFGAPAATPWGRGCVYPGTYYIMMSGCSFPTETVVPRVWLTRHRGDLCADPSVMTVNSIGVHTNTIPIVDCHTIGDGPGEDGSNMGCLGTPTGQKSQWFRFTIDTTGIGKMDLDIKLIENTSATASQVKYRVGYGACDAMTFENCVSEGAFITLNLKCRVPAASSNFWVQTLMPSNATGSLSLEITAAASTDQSCPIINPDLPRAGFNFANGCSGDPVYFTNTSTTGDSVTYLWDFGDGFTSTDFSPTHYYVVPNNWGTYRVTLVVTNEWGNDTTFRDVYIPRKPWPGISPSATTVCIGQPVTYTNTSTELSGVDLHLWNFCAANPAYCEASLSTSTDVNPPAITYSRPGIKTTSLLVDNVNGCDSTITQTVLVLDNPVANAGVDRTITCGDSVQIGDDYAVNMRTDTLTQNKGLFYDSGGPSANFNNNENFLLTIAPPGATSVTMTFTARSGASSADHITIFNGPTTSSPVILSQRYADQIPLNTPIVATSGVMLIRWISNSTTTYGGWIANWNSTTANPLTYSWSPTTGLSDPNTQYPKAAPTATTTYTLTVSNGLCSTTDQVTVNINPLTVDAGPDWTIGCGDSVQIGPVNEVRVSQSRTYLPSGLFFDSGGRNGNFADNENYTYTIAPPNATSVSLTFTSVTNTTDADYITIYNGWNTSAPVLAGPWTLNQLMTNRLNIPIVASSGAMTIRWTSDASTTYAGWQANWTSTGNSMQYSWSPTTGLSNSAVLNPKAAPTATTTYTLTVTTPDGCSATDQATVTVNPLTLNSGPDKTIICGDTVRIGYPDTTVANMSNGASYKAAGWLYDSGGPSGNYGINENFSYLINPVGATYVTMTFSSLAGTDGNDILTIYNGSTTSDPILVSTYPSLLTGTYTATSGRMLIRWTSNATTVYGGWRGNWTSDGGSSMSYSWSPTTALSNPNISNPNAAPTATTTYTLTATGPGGCTATDQVTVTVNPITIDAGSNQTIACGDSIEIGPWDEVRVSQTRTYLPSGTFWDSGGRYGNYADNENYTYTIAPPNATSVSLTFTSVYNTTDADYITIYNGWDASAPVLVGPWTLNQLLTNRLNIPIVANSGAMTIRWTSDASTSYSGWQANWTSTGSSLQYSWSPTTGLSDPAVLNPMASPATTTTYTLTATTPDGCNSTDQVTVTVNPIAFNLVPAYNIPCGDSVQIGPPDTTVVNMTNGGSTYRASGRFYDIGGINGNYTNADMSYLINPIGATTVTINFLAESGDTGDRFFIYDGPTNQYPVLANGVALGSLAASYTATSGQILIVFDSDGDATVGAGWEATWTSDAYQGLTYSWSPTTGLSNPNILSPMAAPTAATTYTLTVSTPGGCSATSTTTVTPLVYTIDLGPDLTPACGDSVLLGIVAQSYNMSNNSSFLPTGRLFDSGGQTGNYGLNENFTFTITPPGASSITLDLVSWTGSDAADTIFIYDGPDRYSTLLYWGTISGMATQYTANSGSVTVRFRSNGATVYAGWEMVWRSTGHEALTYAWTPVAGLSDPTSATPKAAPTAATTYTLNVTAPGGGCVVTDFVTVTPQPLVFSAGNDVTIMCGDSAQIGWSEPSISMTNGGSSYYPSGLFFDSGGPLANFAINSTWVYTIRPAGASSVSLRFLQRLASNASNLITLYNGPDIYSPIIVGPVAVNTLATTAYTATSGVMTIRFVSGATAEAGWEAEWTSTGADYSYSWSPTTGLASPNAANTMVIAPVAATTYTLTVTTPNGCSSTDAVIVTPTAPTISAGPNMNVVCGDSVTIGPALFSVNMADGRTTETRGLFYDSGGPAATYVSNQVRTYTIAPPYADAVRMRFTFRSPTALDAGDYIAIYDGESVDAPLIFGPATINTLSTAADYVANSGAMTIRWVSDNDATVDDGWEARWTTVQSGVSYTWNPATGLSSATELNPRVSITGAPITYTLTMNGPAGCTANSTVTLTPLSFTFNSPDVTGICGDSVRIGYTGEVANMGTAVTNAPMGRLYDQGGPNAGFASAANTWVYSIRPIGASTVTLRFLQREATDGADDHITIYDGPDVTSPVIAGYNMVNTGTIALNTPITATSGMLTIRHVSDGDATIGNFEAVWTSVQSPTVTYSWSPASGLASTSSMNTLAAVPAVATTYTLTVTAPGAACTFTDLVTITPTPLTINAGPDVSMYCGDSATLGGTVSTTTVNMPVGTSSTTEATGLFYDSGGPAGNYTANENRLYTIRPIGADVVSLRFTSVTGTDAQDLVTIYDGPDVLSPILYGPGTIGSLSVAAPYVANSGAITIRFQSDGDGTVAAGWIANWTTTPRSDYSYSWTPLTGLSSGTERYPRVSVLDGDIRTYRLTVTSPGGCTAWDQVTVTGLGYTLDAGPDQAQTCADSVTIGIPTPSVNMSNNGRTWMPYGNFYDSGGAAGNYGAADNMVYTFAPIGATSVTLNFSARAGDAGDMITLYNGPDINSPIITGPIAVGSIALATNFTASSGVMTVRFTNDGDATAGTGWTATWTSTSLTNNPYYTWAPTDGIANVNSPRTKVLASATTTYTLTITSPAGCTPVSDVVTVNVTPHPANLNLDDQVICPSGTLTLNASGSATAYAWQVKPVDVTSAFTYTALTAALAAATPPYSASTTNGTYYPYLAKLGGASGWRSNTTAAGQYLQIDLGGYYPITQVATQGHGASAWYVGTYRLQYSVDGTVWTYYTEGGAVRTFTGNTNNTGIVTRQLTEPVVARYIRFVAQTWTSAISMRVEVYTSPELQNSTLTVNKPGSYTVFGTAAGCTLPQQGTILVGNGGKNGYHYRTMANGNWTDLTTWEVLNDANSMWEPATTFVGCSAISYPSSRSRTITVQHTVDYDFTIPEGIDETTITTAGNLRVPLSRTLYLVDSSNVVTNIDEDLMNQGRFEIEGDFVVVGAGLLYNTDPSTVAYTRAGNQTMWNGKYGRLEIRNGGTKYVSGLTSRANTEVAFHLGHVQLGNYDFSLANAATITGHSWFTGWFVTNSLGQVIKERLGPAATFAQYDFPVGHSNASYNLATMNNAGLTDTFAVRVAGTFEFDNSYSTDLPLAINSVNRTWHVEELRAGGSNVTKRLYWMTDHENPGYIREATRRVHFGAPVGWDYRSTVQAAQGSGTMADPWYNEVGGLTEFSPWTETGDVILASSRLVLSGQMQGEDAQLRWSSPNAPDALYFELERADENGNFHIVHSEPATLGQLYYTHIDRQLMANAGYLYRVRRTHADGSTTLSNVVRLGTAATQQVILFPNPMSKGGEATLAVELQAEASVRIRVVNNLGQEVIAVPTQVLPAGTHVQQLSTRSLAAGVYYVHTLVDGKPYVNKLLVVE